MPQYLLLFRRSLAETKVGEDFDYDRGPAPPNIAPVSGVPNYAVRIQLYTCTLMYRGFAPPDMAPVSRVPN